MFDCAAVAKTMEDYTVGRSYWITASFSAVAYFCLLPRPRKTPCGQEKNLKTLPVLFCPLDVATCTCINVKSFYSLAS